jgi:hypothetical protein
MQITGCLSATSVRWHIHGVIKGKTLPYLTSTPGAGGHAGRKRKQPELTCGRIVEARSPQQIAKEKRRQALPWGVHR